MKSEVGAPEATQGADTAIATEHKRRRRIAVVLGMHRSGTSLLSSIMQYLGCDMADDSDHNHSRNPAGYWERPQLVALHDEILKLIGRPVDRPLHLLPFPAGWWRSREVQAVKRWMMEFVSSELSRSSALWGFKDPRTCRLLPLWNEIFEALSLEPVYVHALRRPQNSAKSMALAPLKSVELSTMQSELMWLTYQADILRYTSDHAIPVIDYDDWFDRPEETVARLAGHLKLPSALSETEMHQIVRQCVKVEYRHHLADAENPDVSGMAPTLYQLLSGPLEDRSRKAAGQLVRVDAFFESVAPIIQQFDHERAEFATFRKDLLSKIAVANRAEAGLRAECRSSASLLEDLKKRLRSEKQKYGEVVAEKASLAAELARLATDDLGEFREFMLRDVRLSRMQVRVDELTADVTSGTLERDALRSEMALMAAAAEQHQREQLAASEDHRRISALEADDLRRQLAQRQSELQASHDECRRLRRGLETARSGAVSSLHPQANPGLPGDPLRADEAALEIEAAIGLRTGGIGGTARLKSSGRVPLIVEARVDDRIVASTLCTATDGGTFFIPWTAFAADSFGKPISVRIAGQAQTIEPALRVPELSQYRASLDRPDIREYQGWASRYGTLDGADLDAARERYRQAGPRWPRVTVVLLDRDGAEAGHLWRSLRSLHAQVYEEWELLVAGEPAQEGEGEPRVRFLGSKDMASAAREATGQLLCFLGCGDELAPQALLATVDAQLRHPEATLVYSDEDAIDAVSGLRLDPYFKGGWSPELFLSQDYALRPAMVSREFLSTNALGECSTAGLYRTLLRGVGPESGGSAVHIPEVLYHRALDRKQSGPAIESALRDAVARCEFTAEVEANPDGSVQVNWPLPDPLPRVSLIVPTRDRLELLEPCVDGFLQRTDYPDLEIVIVDNDSVETATLAYFERVQQDPRVRIVRWSGSFDFSAINNFAVTQATGSIIGLMNNDLKVIGAGWLKAMVRQVSRASVGTVGARLLYADGTLQHAGVVLGVGVASHRYKGKAADHPGHGGVLLHPHDVGAVTAACLLVRRGVWDEVGGLSLEFPVAYNDVDFCLKLRQAGYRVIYEPRAMLYHLESQSRGLDKSSEKSQRLEADKTRLLSAWTAAVIDDPFYSPNLSTESTDATFAHPPRATRGWMIPAGTTTPDGRS